MTLPKKQGAKKADPLVSARDITENRKATDALAKSESRLQRAELASKSGNWELHLDSGKIFGSAGAIVLYGVEAGSLDYKEVRDIPLPECRQMMDEALQDLIAGKKPYNIEFKIRTANTGEILDIYSVAEFDPVNRIVYGAMQDITDRKKIEQQIIRKNKDLTNLFRVTLHLLESLEKRELLAKIVENSANLVGTDTSAIYLVNGQNLLLEVTSPALPENFPAEFRKAKLEHHPHIKTAIDTLKTVIVSDASTTEFTQEERLIVETKNLGSLVYIPLFIQNKVHGVIILGTVGRKHTFEKHEIDLFSTFSNITSLALENSYLFENLKETKEKAEESNNLKTAFLHNISHEIRTPLNAIIGFSALLGQPDLPPEKINEFIGIISQSNNQLLSIIEDILNISRIEARQMSLSETWADLNAIFTNLYSQYHPTAIKKGLEFAIRTSFAGHDPVIVTDEYKIIGILTNLLNNAFKFTLNGRIELGYNMTEDCVEFYVSDTGIGIPASEQGKIFERFYQIDKSMSRFHGGMGLGLAISAAYVEMLGGRISLNSCQGQGSTFSFVIPYKKESSVKPIVRDDSAYQSGVLITGRNILIAEDEDSNYAFICSVLKPLGYNLLRAFNGIEAITICSSDPGINLVLMDIRMPLKDGYESASEILELRPHLPIIAQTAYGFPNDRQTAFEKGCVDYLAKPFTREQLIAMVEKYTKKSADKRASAI